MCTSIYTHGIRHVSAREYIHESLPRDETQLPRGLVWTLCMHMVPQLCNFYGALIQIVVLVLLWRFLILPFRLAYKPHRDELAS